MSRKEYHALKSIVRSFLKNSTIVEFSMTGATGFYSESHDEGFASRYVQVCFGDKPGTFQVREDSWGKDCDGRYSTTDDYTVVKASKRKRYYMGRNWETNRPQGKFGIKSPWKIVERGNSSQQDYTAEAAGY